MAESSDWEILPPAQQSAFLGWDTRDFVRFFVSNLLLILLCLLAGVLAGLLIYRATPRAYEATGSFIVDELPFRQASRSTDAETERQLSQTLILSLSNSDTLTAIARRLDLPLTRLQFPELGPPLKLSASEPVANIRITPLRNTRLGVITATSQDPEFAARVVNAILDELQIYNRVGGLLKNLQVSLDFSQERTDNQLKLLAETYAQRLKLEKETAELDDYTRRSLPLETFPAFADDATLNNLKTQLILVQSEYDGLARTSVRGSRLVAKKAELDGLKALVARQAGRLVEALRSQYKILATQEANVQERVQGLHDKIDNISQEAARISQTTGNPVEMARLLDEYKSDNPSGVANVITIVDRGTPSFRPVRPKLWIHLGLGVLFGGAIGLGLAALRTVLDIRIRSAQQLERQTGRPCLAMLPPLPHPIRHRPAVVVYDQSKYPIGFSYLRTHLLRVPEDAKEKRIIGFTHARPERNCSRLTAYTAVLLAQAEKRTLVVDLHMQQPRIASYYQTPIAKDLAEWFASDDPLSNYVNYSVVQELAVLSIKNPNRPDLNDLLSRRHFAEALVGLLDQWDFILIDAPNILMDWKLTLALPARGRLIVAVRYGRSTTEHVNQTLARARGPGWNVEGFVLTYCPERLAS